MTARRTDTDINVNAVIKRGLRDGDFHLRELRRLANAREDRTPAQPPWPFRADFELTPDGALREVPPVLTMQGEDL